mmetsp:Transcript_21293/g.56963  ORF Transcript_21293/g.56963 Transcript_21293/m.56963 type:complete len:187 (+) Transcript_21293:587-1147(+)
MSSSLQLNGTALWNPNFYRGPGPPCPHTRGRDTMGAVRHGSPGGLRTLVQSCSDFGPSARASGPCRTRRHGKVARSLQLAPGYDHNNLPLVYKTKEFKSLDKSVADMTSDRSGKGSQLKAVLEYYAKVKDRCIAKPESYEERKARREAEIAGLQQALSILESETALVQLRTRRRGSTAAFLGPAAH